MATSAVMYGGPLDGTRTPTDQPVVTFVHPVQTMIHGSEGFGELVRYVLTDDVDRQGCRIYTFERNRVPRLA